jgi:hypothetical protein
MKNLTILLFLGCATFGFAQSENTAADHQEDMEAWEDYYRTSDDDPARSTARTPRKGPKGEKALPENMQRVGCICMDNITRRQTGTGACAGHKGVRFWVYQNENADTMLLATERHTLHPDPLSAEQPIVFGKNTPSNTDKPYSRRAAQGLGVIFGILMVCFAFFAFRKYQA